MKKLLGLKLGVIAVFTANAPARLDLHAENPAPTRTLANVVVGYGISSQEHLSAQQQLDNVVDTCLLEENKVKPFSYFIDQIIEIVYNNKDYFVKKIGSTHDIDKAVEEFKKLKTEKNAMSVAKKLANHCELLSSHSQVYKLIQKAKSKGRVEANKLLALLKLRLAIAG